MADWLPGPRTEQLTMAQNWMDVLVPAKLTAWRIPTEDYNELGTLLFTARDALQKAQSETERTPVVTAQCNADFKALTDKMRFFKNHYFLVPPLTEADIISLGLKPRDLHPTPGKTPTAHVAVETFLVGRHELGIRLIYDTGNPEDKENRGYRIWHDIRAPGEDPPAQPEDLRKSFYTQRRKDLIEFDFGDSGKTAWFAVQVENDGKKGPWGPLVSALIP